MVKGIIGRKIAMSQIFDKEGDMVGVTIIEVGPCYVVQKKTKAKEGYDAVQLGFLEVKKKNRVKRPLLRHFENAKIPPMKVIKEFKIEDPSFNSELGHKITVGDIFTPGNLVDVVGISKGKGFAGVIKRHGFSGSPGSRGTHEYFRHGGSIGMHTFPARVFKGKKMAGRMGCDRVTLKNLKVIEVIKEENLLLVKGAIPGYNGSIVTINKL